MTDRQILLEMFARRNIKLDTEHTDDEAIFIDFDGRIRIYGDIVRSGRQPTRMSSTQSNRASSKRALLATS